MLSCVCEYRVAHVEVTGQLSGAFPFPPMDGSNPEISQIAVVTLNRSQYKQRVMNLGKKTGRDEKCR